VDSTVNTFGRKIVWNALQALRFIPKVAAGWSGEKREHFVDWVRSEKVDFFQNNIELGDI
jgi:hypothetical protein